MFLLQPIMIATYVLLIAIIIFNKGLKTDNQKLIKFSLITAGLTFISVIIFYTDKLSEALILLVLMGLVALLSYLPCQMASKHIKHYEKVYILSHLLALSILGGMRIFLLIANPTYYLFGLLVFSSLYIFRQTSNKLNAFAIIGVLILARAFTGFDYEPPFTFNHIYHADAIHDTQSEIALNESKPVIKAVEYFNNNYGKSIEDVICISKENKTAILLIKTSNNDNYRLFYSDGQISEQ